MPVQRLARLLLADGTWPVHGPRARHPLPARGDAQSFAPLPHLRHPRLQIRSRMRRHHLRRSVHRPTAHQVSLSPPKRPLRDLLQTRAQRRANLLHRSLPEQSISGDASVVALPSMRLARLLLLLILLRWGGIGVQSRETIHRFWRTPPPAILTLTRLPPRLVHALTLLTPLLRLPRPLLLPRLLWLPRPMWLIRLP